MYNNNNGRLSSNINLIYTPYQQMVDRDYCCKFISVVVGILDIPTILESDILPDSCTVENILEAINFCNQNSQKLSLLLSEVIKGNLYLYIKNNVILYR